MAAMAGQLSELDLRVTEASVLFQIAATPGANLSQIGRKLNIKRANVTPLISKLVEQGLIVSQRKDGRAQSLTLSLKGKRKCKAAREVVETQEANFFGALSEEEIAIFKQLLDEIQTAKKL